MLHGQLYVGATFAPGKMDNSVWATLSGPGGNSITATQSDTMTGIGDMQERRAALEILHRVLTARGALGEEEARCYARIEALFTGG